MAPGFDQAQVSKSQQPEAVNIVPHLIGALDIFP
tara:strand:+ start:396 stop:497 length:102 start_codon:yes stop_codon:yes gene_type:complete